MPDKTDKTNAGKPEPQAGNRSRKADALRRNLRRRKEQARARSEAQSRGSDSDGKA
jgi:hypothetical protein